MTIWFFSDPHLGHENIWRKFKIPCPECGKEVEGVEDAITCPRCLGSGEIPMRPFTSTEEMDWTIIDNINALVKPPDHLYCLGDVAMRKPHLERIKAIKCTNMSLVLGNHDLPDPKAYRDVGFKKIMAYRVFDRMMFSHIPIHPASMSGFKANIHGHIHGNDGSGYTPVVHKDGSLSPYINICVEKTDYKPVSLEWITAEVQRRTNEG